MRMKRWLPAILTGTIIASVALADQTPSATEAAIKVRQSYMNVLAYNMGQLDQMVKGDMEYSADLATALATDLVKLTDLSQAGFWPLGSSTEDSADTRALPVAWSDFAATQGYIKDIDAAMAVLAAQAGTREGLEASLRAAAKTCTSCHQAMRAPRN